MRAADDRYGRSEPGLSRSQTNQSFPARDSKGGREASHLPAQHPGGDVAVEGEGLAEPSDVQLGVPS